MGNKIWAMKANSLVAKSNKWLDKKGQQKEEEKERCRDDPRRDWPIIMLM